MLLRYDLDVIAIIGIVLLIGIVKKNAIMMIDFALEADTRVGQSFNLGQLHGQQYGFPYSVLVCGR